MTPQDAHKLGRPLKDALDKYGNWRKVCSKGYSPPHKLPDNWENDPTLLGSAISNLTDALFEPGRRRSEVQEEFRRQLEKAKLIGVGYLSPRQLSDEPQLIPTDVWRLGKINFAESEIENGTLKFENVRIIKPGKNKKITDNKLKANSSEKAPASPNPVGRPSSRDKIFAAYVKLKEESQIDFSKPMTHAYPIIRARLVEQFGTEKGFQNEAMRLAITEDFKAEAERLNPARKL